MNTIDQRLTVKCGENRPIEAKMEIPTPPAPESYVYMFYSAGKVKIGTSADPTRRLDQMQNSSAHPVQVVWVGFGDRRDEERLHAMFKPDRLHGEWFRLSDEIREFIASRSTETAPFAAMLAAAEKSKP